MRTPRLDTLPPVDGCWLDIDVTTQRLTVWEGRERKAEYACSSGLAGHGQHEGSGQTPLGWHV